MEGFTPCKAGSDLWMSDDTYEYVAVCQRFIMCHEGPKKYSQPPNSSL